MLSFSSCEVGDFEFASTKPLIVLFRVLELVKKMFGFSRRRIKIGRLKVQQLSDSKQGTSSPIRHAKRVSKSNIENFALATSSSDELNYKTSPPATELNDCSTSGNSESWMVLSTAGELPTPRFNHAATVVGNKMIVVGGESGQGLLEDVQVLILEKYTWTKAASKLYLFPASLPLKIPACKGHSLVSWGKKALLIGGKTDPGSDRVSVWALDTETECWSLIEAKGEIPAARSGHSVVRAGSVLILFGGEDAKRRKLNDLHMFDLKSLMWLPIHSTGTIPSPRSNHVAALYDDRTLYIFGGTSKSRTVNDLYSLDFETMIWSRIKIRGFHPSPRACCRGVLCGHKWYIAGGGSKKKRHADTLVFDVINVEWSVAVVAPPSSVTTYKGFSLVLVQLNEKVFLVAFGGYKKESSNQVEVLILERNEQSVGRQSTLEKGSCPLFFEKRQSTVDSVARQNLASVLENHGSSRRSMSESTLVNPNPVPHKQFHNEEKYTAAFKILKSLEGDKCKVIKDCSMMQNFTQAVEQRTKPQDRDRTDIVGSKATGEVISTLSYSDFSKPHTKQVIGNFSGNDDIVFPDPDGKSVELHQFYEAKLASLIRKNSTLEERLAAALASKEGAERNLSSVVKSRQDMEKKLGDTVREMELLKVKLSSVELAQEEANSLTNIVHSDNVRLEHDVAFLKAVLDDTQKELHSIRGVLVGERSRAFQLQVEVFHLKQRLQSMENRVSTPRKPFHNM